jgi:Cu2+-containing amine oxidase
MNRIPVYTGRSGVRSDLQKGDSMEDRVRFITHAGKRILHLDFSGCRPEEALNVIARAKKVIAQQPERSLLTLTDVTDTRFSDAVAQEMKHFTAHNRPFVRAAAVVGVTGLKRIIFEAVIAFSKRKVTTFDTIEKAKQWLAEA